MELNHLRCFYEVARAGSFTAAGKSLRISQSALSKAVALLEDAEGVVLLERSKKGVKLTQLGQSVFDRCQVIFGEIRQIQDQFHGATNLCEGMLRFGASDHLTRYLLIDKLQAYRRSYPKVVPSLFAGAPNDIIDQVHRGDLEFGLCFTKIKIPGLEYKRIAPSELIVVVNPQYYRNATLDDINRIGILGSISRQFERHPSYRMFEFLKEDPPINFEVNSQEIQKLLCLAGAGCALLARFMVQEELRAKALREIVLPKPIITDLLMVKRKNHIFTRPAQTFVDEVVHQLRPG
jgi:DNA-binding transcriptional LysR family regulator